MKVKTCTRCIMDTTAKGIHFDELGHCNYCNDFIHKLEKPNHKINLSLESFVAQIKHDGRNKPYDCIVGLSGGIDSSYTLVKVKELGLRPLAVHMDNGWNSELATNNIKNLIDTLEVDLYTHVINWDEYRELMQAFFNADVIDVELLYDNAMLAVNYALASKYGLHYILSGSNTSTEGMYVPENWNWFKYDKKNIKSLAKRHGIKIKTFPIIGTYNYIYYEFLKKIHWIPFLDHLPTYNKFDAMELLEKKFKYKQYPYKHYESIFTRFYQGYILPVKFNIDKRKLHLSSLIISKQMTREDALLQMESIPYPSEKGLEEDKEYFLKKMRWTKEDLDTYLQRPEVPHSDYGSERSRWNQFKKIYFTIKNRR